MGMQMAMQLMAVPSLKQILVCKVCHQPIDGEEVARTTRVMVPLFGALPYAICPGCNQEVDGHEDRGYRIRAGKLLRLRRCELLQEAKRGRDHGTAGN